MTGADQLIIVLYFGFLLCAGWLFRGMNRNTNEYFVGGRRMAWWLSGADAFVTNFSCWVFVGAAQIAYDHGFLIFGFYAADALGFFLAYLWFAAHFRQLRVVTPMDAIRLRFGKTSEQFFGWLTFLSGLLVAAVRLLSLVIVLSSAFQLSPTIMILSCGGVAIIVGLIGGNWAIAASNFVQLAVLLGLTIVVSIVVLVQVGGIGPLLAHLPAKHFTIFHPAGSIPYDWCFIAAGILGAGFAKNSLLALGKYVTAKDSGHARLSALVPAVGYLVLPIIWIIPPLAAYSILPDLPQQKFLTTPGESSYIAVCLAILPPGLTGLLVVCMLSATMSNLGDSLNKSAAIFVSNFYKPLFRPQASQKELLLVGRSATVIFGIVISLLTLAAPTLLRVSVFDAFLYIGAYLGLPITVPLFLAMFYRRAPAWSAWLAALVGILATTAIYVFCPSPLGRTILEPFLGSDIYGYLVSNQFVATNLFTVPVTAIVFLATGVFARAREDKRSGASPEEFFRRLHTRVDFDAEVGADNTPMQARRIGRLTFAAGAFILLLIFVPDSNLGRAGIIGCASLPLALGATLIIYARRDKAGSR